MPVINNARDNRQLSVTFWPYSAGNRLLITHTAVANLRANIIQPHRCGSMAVLAVRCPGSALVVPDSCYHSDSYPGNVCLSTVSIMIMPVDRYSSTLPADVSVA